MEGCYDAIIAALDVVVEDGCGEAVVSDVIVGEDLEEKGALAGVPRPGAKLRYVLKGVVLGGVPDHASAPDDLEEEVEVSFEKLDDAESVDFWRPWIFFEPDLESSAPTGGRAAEFNSKGEEELMKREDPWSSFWTGKCLVVSDVSA